MNSRTRAAGVIAVTVHMRMNRTSSGFLAETASNTSCAMITRSRTVILRYRLSKDSTRRLLSSVYRNLSQQTEIAQHAAGAEHHRSQRIVGNRNWQPSLFTDAFIEIF